MACPSSIASCGFCAFTRDGLGARSAQRGREGGACGARRRLLLPAGPGMLERWRQEGELSAKRQSVSLVTARSAERFKGLLGPRVAVSQGLWGRFKGWSKLEGQLKSMLQPSSDFDTASRSWSRWHA